MTTQDNPNNLNPDNSNMPNNINNNAATSNASPSTSPDIPDESPANVATPHTSNSASETSGRGVVSSAPTAAAPTTPDISPDISPDIPSAVTTINIGEDGASTSSAYADIMKKGKVMLALIVGFVALIIIGAIALAAKKAKSPTGSVVTLTYWGLWDGPEIMQPLIKEYEKTHPNIKINYIQQDFGFTSDNYAYVGTYYASVAERLTKTGGVDIMRVHVSWLPNIINFLYPAPANIFPAKEVADNYYKPVIDASVISGAVYDIPLYLDGLVMFYNPQLFENAGIKQIPDTWEDILTDAPKLTIKKNGHIEQAGVAIGTGTNIFHSPEILLMMFTQANVPVIDIHNRRFNFATEEALAALKYYTDFAKKYKVWSYTLPSDLKMFAECRLAMLFAPSFRAINFMASNPDLNFKVKAPPVLPGARPEVPRYIASYYTEVVPKNAPHPKEAWKFLHWLSQPAQLQKLYELQKQAHKTALPSPRKDINQTTDLSLTASTIHEMAPKMKVWFLYDMGIWEKKVREFLTQLEGQDADINISDLQNLQQQLNQVTFNRQ